MTCHISINKEYVVSDRPHMDAAEGKTQQELGCKGIPEQSWRRRRVRSQGSQGVVRSVEGTLGSSWVMQMENDVLMHHPGTAGFMVSC